VKLLLLTLKLLENLAKTSRNKSVGPDVFTGEILNFLGGSHDFFPSYTTGNIIKQCYYPNCLGKKKLY
jgi:hypothetical protein